MGVVLQNIYDVVTKQGGYEARLILADKTGIPRVKANQIKDTDEVIAKFINTGQS